MRRIVVIGGGVSGCAVAWHLAERGLGEVTLLERDRLGSGSTWHSAGNITWKPVDDNDAQVRYVVDLAGRLERETGLTTGWRQMGRLFVARDAKMLKSFEVFHEAALAGGVGSEMLDAGEAAARHPFLAATQFEGAWFNGFSGRVNPADLVAVYARAAKQRGAGIVEECTVGGIVADGGKVSGVIANGEMIACDDVVVCAGLWSRDLARPLDLALGQWGCEHFYIICDMSPRLGPETPTFVSPADMIYGREEVGGLLLGCFDEDALPVATSDLPDPFSFALLQENWDKFAPYFERAMELLPALEHAPVRKFINGPESFTPDGNPLIGPASGIEGMWLCTGMNSHGVTLSGAAGHIVADMLEGVEPRFPAGIYDPDRFGAATDDEAWLQSAVSKTPSAYYTRSN
jgi:4-methylaminobutanoate oxidase (formaldehyde-forming)